MGKSITTSSSTSSTKSQSHSASASQSEKRSESTSSKYLDEKLRDEILSGLIGQMTDEEIAAYAEGLLRPQLNAALEASQHEYETAKLAREQEIENLAVSLASAIAAQQGAYSQAMADTQNAALARGMGRSSYVMENLAGHGSALASSVRSLTEENQRLRSQIQQQITQAAQHNAKTQGRLNTDYAANIAAKIQELRAQQRQEYNQNYMSAVSGSLGQKTTGRESEKSSSTTDTTSTGSSNSSSISVTRTYK